MGGRRGARVGHIRGLLVSVWSPGTGSCRVLGTGRKFRQCYVVSVSVLCHRAASHVLE